MAQLVSVQDDALGTFSYVDADTLVADHLPATIDASDSALLNGQPASYYLDRSHHTGMQSADTLTDGTTNRLFTTTEKNLLDGATSTATPNTLVLRDANGQISAAEITGTSNDSALLNGQPGSYYLSRANHTGTQSADTLTDGATNRLLTTAEKNAIDGATNLNTASTIVKRDASGNFTAGTITATLSGNASTATTASNSTNLNGQPASYYLNFANSTGTRTHTAISDFDTQVRTSALNQMAVPTAAVSFNGKALTNLLDPVNPQDAGTKNYIDAQDAATLASANGQASSVANSRMKWRGAWVASTTYIANDVIYTSDHRTWVCITGNSDATFTATNWSEVGITKAFIDAGFSTASITASGTVSAATLSASGQLSGASLSISGNSALTGTLSAGNTSVGTFSSSGLATLQSASVTTTLGVSGATTLAGLTATTVHGTGAAQFDTTLRVTGTTTLGVLNSGNTAVSGTLSATGTSTLAVVSATNVTASGTLGVSGTSTLGALNATNASFSGTLGVTGTTTLGNASVGGTLSVTGASTVAGLTAGATSVTTLTTSGLANIDHASVVGDVTLGGNLDLSGSAPSGGNATIAGTLGVSGASTLADVSASSLSSSGTLSVTGTSTLGAVNSGNTAITGTLSASGASTLATVSATNVTASGTLGVTGATTLAGLTASTVHGTGAATFDTTLKVTGTSTLGAVNSGSTAITGTLSTSGAATLNSASITGNATVGGTLGVTGTTALAGLNAGNTAVTGTLSSSGAATLNSASVTNNATVGGTLGVTGATTLAGLTAGATSVSTLSTSGLATLSSASITGNATVGGTLGVTGATTLAGLTAGTTGVGALTATALTVNGNGNVTGAFSAGTLQTSNATRIDGSGALSNITTISASGNANIGGVLSVTGNVNIGPVLTFANPGIGNDTQFRFLKNSDTAGITVTEVTNDQTWYAFTMSDNPDSGDEFTMQWGDYTTPGSGWSPFWYTGFQHHETANAHYFDGNVYFNNGPFFTAKGNSQWGNRDYIRYNSGSNVPLSTGSGTLTMALACTGYTAGMTVYWVTLTSPTTFNWGTGKTTNTPLGSNITTTPGTAQPLQNGLTVTFSTSGVGVTNDTWTWRQFGSTTVTSYAPVQVSNAFGVSGAASFSGTLAASSTATFSGAANFNSTATFGGTTTLGAAVTLNGTMTASAWGNYTVSLPANTIINQNAGYVANTPTANQWHDILAFDHLGAPTYETTADGTTWATATYDPSPFIQQDHINSPVANGSTIIGGRWTWHNGAWLSYASGAWLQLAFIYTASGTSKNVLVESSSDGVNWTTRNTSVSAANASTSWHYISSWGGDIYLRVTLTAVTTTTAFALSSMQVLSARPGDTAGGKEFSYPYSWDKYKNITVGNDLTVPGNTSLQNTAVTGTLTASSDTTVSGVVYGKSRARFGFNNGVTAVTPLTTSAAEFELSAQSLITIGEDTAGSANPQITWYRTNSGSRSGQAFRQFLPASAGPFKWQWGNSGANYGAETYTDAMTLDRSNKLSVIGAFSAGGAVTLTGNTTVGGTFGVTGNTTLSNASINGTLGVTGTSTLGAVNSGNTAITGTLSTTGAATFNSATVQNTLTAANVNVSGTLSVSGAVTFTTKLAGSQIAYDTITGGGGSGVGNIAGSTIQAYNIADGAITLSKISQGAAAAISTTPSDGNTRTSMFRYVTASGTDTDPNTGMDLDGLSVAAGAARVADAAAMGGNAIQVTSAAFTGASGDVFQAGPGYGSNSTTEGPGLAPGTYRATVYAKISSNSGGQVVGFEAYDATAGVVTTTAYTFNASDFPAANAYYGFSIPVTITADSAGSAGFQIRSRYYTGTGATVSISHVQVEPYQGLAPAEVTTNYIADLAVTDAKIQDLTVSKLTSGTINVDDIFLGSGGHVYAGVSTHPTGNTGRVELNSAGLYGYDGTQQTFALNDTGLTLTGSITATSGAITGPLDLTSANGKLRIATSTPGNIGDGTANSAGILITNSSFKAFAANSSTPATSIDATTGAFVTTSGTFTGSITASSGTIGGFTLTSTTLNIGGTTASSITLDSANGIYLGGTSSAAPFRVTKAGALTATSANITGTVTASSGTIGGFTLSSTMLNSGGTGTSSISLDKSNGIYLGGTSSAAPFRVTLAGALTATNANITGAITANSGAIGGFTITGSTLNVGGTTASSVTLDSANGLYIGGTSAAAPFRVTTAGALTASNANITGIITANAGTIGGFAIGTTTLNTGGTGASSISLDSANGIYLGGSSSTAPFRVTTAGALTATNATITGNITATSGSFTGSVTATTGTVGGFTLSASTLNAGGTTANSVTLDTVNGIYLGGSSTTAPFRVTTAGALTATNANITGTITANAGSFTGTVTASTGTIGGFTLSGTTLNAGGTGASSITLDTAAGIYLGGTSSTAPFRVSLAGALTASNATITGTVTASSGAIGGFTLSSTMLNAGGTGTSSVSLDTANGIYLGGTSSAAPFRVTTAGALTATNATITGAITATSGSFTGSITSSSGTIGGFALSASTLNTGGTGASSITLDTANGIYVGGTSAAAPFRVSLAGALTASNANITGTVTATAGTIGGFSLSSSTLNVGGTTASSVTLDSANGIYAGGSSSTAPFRVTTAGALTATNATITGAITATSGSFTGSITSTSGTIGGFTLSGSTLNAGGTGASSVTLDTANGIYLGGTSAAAPFRVTTAGALTATNATITGTITASTGTIGGFTLSSTTLNIGGTGTSSISLDSANGIYLGGTSAAAPFRVTKAGALTATNATITGAITATSGSFTGTVTASAGTIGGFTLSGSTLNSGGTGVSSITLDKSNGIYLGGTSTGAPFRVTLAGALTATNANITGTLTSTSGTIGGFTLSSGMLNVGGTGTSSISLDTAAGIYLGGTSAAAPFRVDLTGALTATNATITGAITATSGSFTGSITSTAGTIGGFSIGGSTLNAGGTSANSVTLDTANGIYAGGDSTTAPFRVTTGGVLNATNATIGGTITATGGNIGGFAVSSTILNSGGTGASSISLDTGAGIYLGGTSTGAPFRVNLAGQLTATGATISGAITATSGSFTGTVTASNGTIGGFTLSGTSLNIGGTTTSSITLDTANGIYLGGTATGAPFRVTKGGALTATSANITGTVTASAGTIGGFALSGTTLNIGGTGTSSITLDSANGIYLGGTSSGAPFRVTKAGTLNATGATISGTITATGGTIGGFTLSSTMLNIGGTGTSSISLDSANGIYMGGSSSTAPFRVDKAGNLTATAATITGAITATSGSFTGTITASSGTIGGFSIGSTALTAGSGTSALGLDTSQGIYAGATTFAAAPFSVAMDGTVTQTVSGSSLIRTASSGPRVELNTQGLYVYNLDSNGSEYATVTLSDVDGSATFNGSITISGPGSISSVDIGSSTIGNSTLASGTDFYADPDGGSIIIQSATTTTSVYTTTGAGTWVCPAGVTSITVEVWGGGGGGTSDTWFSGGQAHYGGGGGGGGGEYAKQVVSVTPGNTYNFTVGAGGTAGGTGTGTTNNTYGNNGGNSSFTADAGVVVTAHGGHCGSYGSSSESGQDGAGGTGSTADTHYNGGAGALGKTVAASYPMGIGGGGGGGGAGSSGSGKAGSQGSYGTSGTISGGSGGAGGNGNTGGKGGAGGKGGSASISGQSTAVGTAAGSIGAGGAGGAIMMQSPSDGHGGNATSGAGGQVRISYNNSTPSITGSISSTGGTDQYGNSYPAGIRYLTPQNTGFIGGLYSYVTYSQSCATNTAVNISGVSTQTPPGTQNDYTGSLWQSGVMTIPADGVYSFHFLANSFMSSSTRSYMSINQNGSPVARQANPPNSATTGAMSISAPNIWCLKNDQFTFTLFQSTGSTATIGGQITVMKEA